MSLSLVSRGSAVLLAAGLAAASPLAASTAAKSSSPNTINLPITISDGYSFVTVSIGTPGQEYSLLFDTGSATTWVVDAACTACREYAGYERIGYNASESSTSSSNGGWGYIGYIGGYTYGPGKYDVFSLPDHPETKGWNQTFLSVTGSTMTYFPGEGFLGLAFNTITDGGTSTLFETLMTENVVPESRFSIYYGTDISDEFPAPNGGASATNDVHKGMLTLGGSNEELFVEGGVDTMTWVPLHKLNGMYQVWRSDIFAITGSHQSNNNGTITPTENTLKLSGSWAVFDTGSGRSTIPSSIIEEVYASIGMNWTALLNGDHIPLCSEFNSSWSISFDFGEGRVLDVPGNLWREPGFAHREDACWPPFDDSSVEGFFLFGSNVLQKMYTVWEFGAFEETNYAPTVGFGKLKEEYLPGILAE